MTDLTYTTDGLFTRFYPETEAGKKAWTAMHQQGSEYGVILTAHASNVLYQLRKAGYKVSKAKPVKWTQKDEDILNQLLTN